MVWYSYQLDFDVADYIRLVPTSLPFGLERLRPEQLDDNIRSSRLKPGQAALGRLLHVELWRAQNVDEENRCKTSLIFTILDQERLS